MQIRRVVSGQDKSGKSKVVSDEIVQAATVDGVTKLALLWAADAAPQFPASGERTTCPSYFPKLGGYRFLILTLPTQTEAKNAQARLGPENAAAGRAEIERQVGSGLFSIMEPDHPGMHTTDTIDFVFILSGEVWLELDDGEEVHLKTGNTFVQNGTRHRWSNRGTQPAEIAVVMIGGHPRQGAA